MTLLILLWVVGVVATGVMASNQGRSVVVWMAVALIFSPLVALPLLAFGAMGKAFSDGADCAKAGFLKYRADWRTAAIRCPCCDATGKAPSRPSDSCQLCSGNKVVVGEIARRYREELDRRLTAEYENPTR